VTVLRWHREIVRRKWTYGNAAKRGRPPTPAATVALIVRFAGENRAWGDGKIQGELLKVGHRVSCATIKRVLRRQRLAPAPRRGSITWRVLSIKVGAGDAQALGGAMRPGMPAAQAIAATPVTARQVAKRSALVWR
jgi:hypothetical protein